VLLAWDVLATHDASTGRRRGRVGLWLVMVLCQGLLFWLHSFLDARLQRQGPIVLDHEAFRFAHRTYLWIHTVQWMAALVFLLLMLLAWRSEDRA
jgi:hypothetical protein